MAMEKTQNLKKTTNIRRNGMPRAALLAVLHLVAGCQISSAVGSSQQSGVHASADAVYPTGYSEFYPLAHYYGFANQLDKLQSCQVVHTDSCTHVDGMGKLSVPGQLDVSGNIIGPEQRVVDNSKSPPVYSFNVTGLWDETESCTMGVNTTGMQCPEWSVVDPEDSSNCETKDHCAKCAQGYITMNVRTYLIGNFSTCAQWFTRADAITRAALIAVRTNSVETRIATCAAHANVSKPVSCPAVYAWNETLPSNNDGWECITANGQYTSSAQLSWVGSESAAKTKCEASPECKYIHDWGADGNNWRACKVVQLQGSNLKASVKVKGSPIHMYTWTDAMASNDGWVCLTADGTYTPKGRCAWTGNEDAAKARCAASPECKYIHDYNADGNGWRACKSVRRLNTGHGLKAAVKVKGCPS